jgi:thiol:disulfide interchange protein
MKKTVLLLLSAATLLLGQDILWEKDYHAAVAKAKKADKPIFFVFSSHQCKWCRHLETTTFSDPDVIARLNKHFVNVIAYTDEEDYVPRELWMPGTPALWFLDRNGEAMFQAIQGSVGPTDFLGAVDIVLKAYEKNRLKQRYGNQGQ